MYFKVYMLLLISFNLCFVFFGIFLKELLKWAINLKSLDVKASKPIIATCTSPSTKELIWEFHKLFACIYI
ncbi:transmembrane protein [Arabidopsis thaliana]|uniref:Transmembrane protein n=2 Tax=Arabidopsis thaliana TaxID=3702 RepID=A0A5S9XWV5_ARATH|nr:uncharacterized protein AT4G29103 [Arabidopsis thaliana]AEE85587.1 transmembrane protein [Arabidopsis thaliana]CAA0396874.1 unnamed protein product [Arabidopsis thaliana]|eukprot:NP_001119077.1 transmembrane protein [Arabidopsis thaliana]